MERCWIRLASPTGGGMALVVLDGAVDDRGWDEQRHIVKQALDDYEAQVRIRVGFLGSRTVMDYRQLASDRGAARATPRDRVRLLGPVLASVPAGDVTRVAVLAAGGIHDLADVRQHPLMPTTLLLRLDEPAGGVEARIATLRAHVHDPVRRIRLASPSAIPIYWDDPRFVGGPEGLVGEFDPTCLSGPVQVLAGFLRGDDRPLEAWIERSSGAVQQIPCREATPVSDREWFELPAPAADALRLSLAGQGFTCPRCQGTHTAGTTRCRRSGAGIIGRAIFVDREVQFPGHEGAAFALIRVGARIECRLHPCACLRVQGDHVAGFDAEGAPVLYVFDHASRRWGPSEQPLRGLIPVEESLYALPI
jgi:hypothetical protein